jgi:hypothetical protein
MNKTPDSKAVKLNTKTQIMMMREFIGNALDSRAKLLRGLLDGENRSIDDACKYPETITPENYQLMYDREGLGYRVVKAWPEETWSQDFLVTENADPELTEFEKAWEGFALQHNVYHYLARLDEQAGIGDFGVLLLGINDGKKLSEPVDGIVLDGEQTGRMAGNGVKNRKLLYMSVFPRKSVKVAAIEVRTDNPRYRAPTKYTLSMTNMIDGHADSIEDVEVHWTRIIPFADLCESSDISGKPRQMPVWNRLLDVRKICGGSAEMFWKGGFPGYSFEKYESMEDATLDVDSLRDEISEFLNGLNRFFAAEGGKLVAHQASVASPMDHMMVQLKMVAMTVGIPWRILFGSEEAKIAGQQDRESLDSRVDVRRSRVIIPRLVRPFIDRLITMGILPVPVGDENNQAYGGMSYPYNVAWPARAEGSPKEQAETSLVLIDILVKYIQGDCESVLPLEVLLTRYLSFTDAEAKELADTARKRIEEMDDENEDDDLQSDDSDTSNDNTNDNNADNNADDSANEEA